MRYRNLRRGIPLASALLAAVLLAPRTVDATATITVVNRDGAGEGFNDPSTPDAASTAGGNTGASLGEQRLIAFQRAAEIWGQFIESAVEIKVAAKFDPLPCGARSAALGAAGPKTVFRDFSGAPRAGTWYPAALANALNGSDLDTRPSPNGDDIGARFNSAIGTTCAFPNVWYYGLDANPPPGTIDFITVVLHELGHGLGFISLVSLSTGARLLGFDDTYMLNLENHATGLLYPNMTDEERLAASTSTGELHWVGSAVVAAGLGLAAGRDASSGHVEMYAPNPPRPGSSVSHFSNSLRPNELMEPFFTGVDQSPGLAKALIADIGWQLAQPLLLGQTSTNQNWKSVSFPRAFLDPVVIAGAPTFRDSQAGVVRLRNVGATSFETRFQEWAYLDGVHTEEDLPYLVAERGRHVMADGSIWEVGSFPLGGTGRFQAEDFSAPFAAPPSLFLTVQSFSGSQPVTVRARDVTVNGFEAALFEEQALMNGHVVEEVGYLAIYSPTGSGEVRVGAALARYLLQSPSVDERFVPVLSSTVKLEEEQSADTERGHVDETLSVLALGAQIFAQDVSSKGGDTVALRRLAPEYGAPIEWGTVEGVTDDWTTVPLAKSYVNPVVVAKPVSANGVQPGLIRVRNVRGDSFDLRYQEWRYLDGTHKKERVFYLVAEAGQFTVAGLDVEAGKLNSSLLLSEGFETVTFSTPFLSTPAVFTGVMTANGSDPVITRVDDLAPSGFFLTMDEEEIRRAGGHITETLGWIAAEQGSVTTSDSRAVMIGSTTAIDQPATKPFGVNLDRKFPVIVGDVTSTNENDPVSLRYRNLTPSSVKLFLQEEQSLDSETIHAVEDVSIFVAE